MADAYPYVFLDATDLHGKGQPWLPSQAVVVATAV